MLPIVEAGPSLKTASLPGFVVPRDGPYLRKRSLPGHRRAEPLLPSSAGLEPGRHPLTLGLEHRLRESPSLV
jgi:hypothetical protein